MTENDVIVFTVTREQYEKYFQWQRELDERLAKEQLETGKLFDGKELNETQIHTVRRSIEGGEPHPYYGAIGGAYMWKFTSTSMGTIIKVENCASGDVLDLTNYDDW